MYRDDDTDYSYVMRQYDEDKHDLFDRLMDWDRDELVTLLLEFVWMRKELEK